MRNSIARFVKDESGAIEYALIALGIAVAIIVAVNALGQKLVAVFNSISAKLVPAT
ncbi:MAG TPA: Flp family type IVb pilin [Methyloceanibacter sp.]|jgi:pilus assembly protein Flp/PilA